jgi:hypothetical protein
MSGGNFNYKDLETFRQIEDTLFQESIGAETNYASKLKELVKIIGDLVHAYDWYISGDTGEDTYLKEFEKAKVRLQEELKK